MILAGISFSDDSDSDCEVIAVEECVSSKKQSNVYVSPVTKVLFSCLNKTYSWIVLVDF